LNTDWNSLDAEKLQADVINLPLDELGRRFTAFLRNGCRLSIKGPNALIVDRAKPFDPVAFIGRDWSVVEEDDRSLALTDIDFGKVRFESGLKGGESVIVGEEKLRRLKKMPEIRLDAKSGQTLYEEKGQTTLRSLHEHFGVTWFELAGTILRDSLRDSDGDRYFLYLTRHDDGSWDWGCDRLDDGRRRGDVSPLHAS
jgi:hypothetical protein